eukprot:TRINITY_DN22583_c0_g1_i1.p1 TRINITY_DN22583_c0_g1~~TRINITY_DN22583_c0_g1_i1.p1  ORF type:complete len:748 (-),score=117.98 TRINITY_DN22583_c0_g1_i1:377-2620(-)
MDPEGDPQKAIRFFAPGVILLTWICIALAFGYKEFVTGAKTYVSHLKTWCQRPSATDNGTVEWRWKFVELLNDRLLIVLMCGSFIVAVSSVRQVPDRWMVPAQENLFAAAFAAAVLLRVVTRQCPGLQARLGLSCLDLSYLYFACSVLFIGLFVRYSSNEALFASDILASTFRLCVSMLPLDKRFVLLGNILCEVSVLWKFSEVSSASRPGLGYLDGVAFVHIFATVLFVNSPLFAGRVFLAEVKADAKARTMGAGARGLLTYLCDATVDMDGGFRLIEDSPSLSGLLFKAGSNSLAGSLITDWMPDDAAHRFCETMKGAGGEPGSEVGALQVHLRTLLGKLVPFEAFYIWIGWEKRYLLGICKSRTEDSALTSDMVGETVLRTQQQMQQLQQQHQQQTHHPLQTLVQTIGRPQAAAATATQPLLAAAGQEVAQTSDPEQPTSPPGVEQTLGLRRGSTGRKKRRSTSASRRSSNGKVLSVGRLATTLDTKHAMINDLLKSVNFERRGRPDTVSCCKKHTALKELLQLVVRLQSDGCGPNFTTYTNWQCQSCGVMRNSEPADHCCRACLLREVYRAQIPDGTLAVEDQPAGAGVGAGLGGFGDDATIGLLDNCEEATALALAVSSKCVTSLPVRTAMVEELMRNWNFVLARRRKKCCPKHTCLEHLFTFLAPLQNEACEHSFEYYDGWQCVSCGGLDIAAPADGLCRFCGQVDPSLRPQIIAGMTASDGALGPPPASPRPEAVATIIL